VHLDDESYELSAGEVFLLLPGRRERFEFRDVDHAWLHFKWVNPKDAQRETPAPLPFTAQLTPRMKELLAIGIKAQLGPEEQDGLLAGKIAECLWVEFMKQVPEDYSAAPPPHPSVEKARRYIDSRWSDDIHLSDIAAAAHVTPRHLIRLFKKEIGQTSGQYLWNLRTVRAIGLLKSTGLRIGEIADQTGFKSIAHFSRAIRAETGVSPTEVRRRYWSGADRKKGSDKKRR
jgi:AraC family transcriptional regulator of arabinose operon